METVGNLIKEVLSTSTRNGLTRISYMPYNMDFALSVVARIGKGITPQFVLTPEIIDVYEELVRYFHGDSAFRGDLTKGILLMGPTGTGKTLAMKIMSIYRQIDDIKFLMYGKTYKMNYEIIDVNQLVSYFLDSAFDGIDTYCRRYVVCLDDIGTESSQAKYYGNSLDVVSHVIAERYTRRLLTFGTTNFPVKVLEQKYEDRIVSRMYSLFNFLTMKCPDFRKNKNL